MPYISEQEVYTHLYAEVITEINRDVDTRLTDAIDAAVEEARGYLVAYDVTAIFNATGSERNPVLVLYTKDIAVWHYIQLANPAVDMELRKVRYDLAIAWLKNVQSGKTNPTLPLPATVENVPNENFLRYGSFTKRPNNF